ncbi:MAG: GntR family transcriptional regulator [Kiritimatiellae bacterium]|nr:GntR family transcriptional regulator [Kiritimatiellia bacterium]
MSGNETKYGAIYESLKADIVGGYRTGRLPSEAMLVRRFGCSRITVVRALRELCASGLAVRQKGRGTFVAEGARGRVGPIGVVIPISRGEMFPPLCQAITKQAQQDHRSVCLADLMAGTSGDMLAVAKRVMGDFLLQKVAGVVFQLADGVPEAARMNKAALDMLSAANMPVVLVDCDVERHPRRSGYDVIGSDDFDAGYRMARHMAERGARRIAYLMPRFGNSSFQDRGRGIMAATGELGAHGIAKEGVFESVAAVRRFVRSFKPDAIVCGNDRLAATLMPSLAEMGVRIPEDLLLGGFDDVNFARLVTPGLTTMHRPCHEIGEVAYKMLLERIANPGLRPRHIRLSAYLVERDSTRRSAASS